MFMRIDKEHGPSVRSILKIILLVIFIGMAVNVLIAFLMDKTTVLKSLDRVRVTYLIIPFCCYLMVYFIDSFRTVLVARQFSARVPVVQAFFNSVIGVLINNLTPMAAGGQPFQIYHLQQQGLNARIATNIILSRFVENAMVLMTILVVSTPVIIQISQSLAVGGVVMYVGLAVTFVFAIFFLVALIKPDMIGSAAFLVRKSFIGRLIKRLTRKDDWADRMVNWSTKLREEVRFLWTEKVWIMAFDTLLGIIDLLLQVTSLYYVIIVVVGAAPNFFSVLMAYVVVWQVVFYIPTPGASGSIEGAFAMVYSELTHNPALTLVSIIVWRFATYYLHIFFGTIILSLYIRTRRNAPSDAPE